MADKSKPAGRPPIPEKKQEGKAAANADAPVPKYKPRVKASLAETGVTAKVYAAYFGAWRKITDVYREVYSGEAKQVNTGRISEATKALLQSGLLEKREQEARWPLYRASLEWLFQEFAEKRAALQEEEKKALVRVLFPPTDAYKEKGPSFSLSAEEASGKKPFVPTPHKIRDFLHASVALALFLLGNPKQGLPEPAVSSTLDRIKRNLSLYEQNPKLGQKGGSAELAEGPIVESFASFLLVRYKTALRDREPYRNTLLYKLVNALYDERSAELLWRHVEEAS